MTYFNKIKRIFNSFMRHFTGFCKETEEYLTSSVKSGKEARNLLLTDASVENINKIEKSVFNTFLENGKWATYMPKREYTKHYVDSFCIVRFGSNKDKKIPDNVCDVLRGLDVGNNVPTIYAVENKNGELQYFMKINQGKNGNGDFVNDDMKSVIRILDALEEKGATWRNVTDLKNDIVDDLSSWVIPFMV